MGLKMMTSKTMKMMMKLKNKQERLLNFSRKFSFMVFLSYKRSVNRFRGFYQRVFELYRLYLNPYCLSALPDSLKVLIYFLVFDGGYWHVMLPYIWRTISWLMLWAIENIANLLSSVKLALGPIHEESICPLNYMHPLICWLKKVFFPP